MNVATLLDLARLRGGLDSDRKLSAALRLGPATIGAIRIGRQLPSDATVVSLCRIGNADPAAWLLWLSEQRAPEPAKGVYKRLRESLGTTLAVGVLACALVAFAPRGEANAAGTSAQYGAESVSYATIRRLGRLLRWLVNPSVRSFPAFQQSL